MNIQSHPARVAAIAAPILFDALLPAQGYIAMTATHVRQTNAPYGLAAAGIAERSDGSWVVFGGEQSSMLLAGTFVVSNDVWQLRNSLSNPAQRMEHQLTFDAVRGDGVMFGGKDVYGNVLGDTWVFASDQWSYRPTTSPTARSGHRMCFDAARGVVVLFGGMDAAQTLLGDTWTWNGTAWAQVATAVAPVARHEHGVAYDAYRQKVVLFGGEAANGLRSDVWDWDGASWVEVVPPLVNGVPFGPVARKQHAMGFDAVAERMVVFGGDRGSVGYGNDAWAFDGAKWVGLTAGLANPPSRAKPCCAAAPSGRLRVFGGVSASAFIDDMWELSVPVQPRAFEYGTACLGSGGPLELRINAGAEAAIGATLGMRMTGMSLSFAVGFGFAGFSRTSVSGIPLPVDLAAVGIPGCNAYNSADIDFSLGLPSGSPLATNWNLAIPNDGYFLGLDLYLQALALEGFGYPRFATVTNGVGMRIGMLASTSPPTLPGPPASLHMALIQPGTFQMGNSAGQLGERPSHVVTISRPFWIGRYEVTGAQYQSVMGNNPSFWQGDSQLPVETVSWNSAIAFCASLSASESAAGRMPDGYQYRLPTEAEWEYACRAGSTTEWSTGSSLGVSQANIGSVFGRTAVVGSYPANPWGLFDVHGNVYEWCLDSWDGAANYPASATSDPYVTGGHHRVLRGGSWYATADGCRSSARGNADPATTNYGLGFRVVLAPVLVP